MTQDALTGLLESIARKAHAGQTDKLGRDYCDFHLARVAAVCAPFARPIAWGHDLLEDTKETPDSLYKQGVPLWVIEEIQTLTKRPHESYADFIACVCDSNRVYALHVKIADVLDHYIDVDKLDDASRERLKLKYNGVLGTLRAALARVCVSRNRQSDNSFLRGYML
jgi:hypothetical protein